MVNEPNAYFLDHCHHKKMYMNASYLDMELNLNDAGGPDPGVEDVLGGGDVAVLAQPSDVLQEVLGAVRQLILVGPQEGRL